VETVPVNDLVQLARSAFSHKDFSTALQLLTRALSKVPDDINLLDSRAACLEKLGQLDKALDDAKAMIRTFPQNPKVSNSSHDIFAGIYLISQKKTFLLGRHAHRTRCWCMCLLSKSIFRVISALERR